MSPPFIVAPRTSIVDETPPSTKKFKIWNMKFFSFQELKSATKSKQNGLMKRNRSKSPENRSKSIVNETPSSSGIKSTENRSKSIVNETPSSSGNIKTLNPKVFTYAEMKIAKENFRSSSSGNIKTLNLKVFTYAELKSATENFNLDSLVGEGGYGQVFKGWVHEKTYQPSKVDVRMAVAIKKSQLESFQGVREWQTEIEFLGNLSHPNIIKLVGYCSKEDKEYLLVYKYAQKGSLENHLFKNSAEPLPWSIRLKIAIGAARGLAFLHTSKKPVIHRDFKSANILLDGDYNAKLADFGLAKYAPSKGDAQVTTQIKGTLGPTNDDMQVTMQISWPNGDTQVTTQVRGTLSSTNNDTQLTTQISRSNCETHVTTQLRSMLGSTNSDMHVTTHIRGMSNLANDDRHVTTHIRTNPAHSDTHVTTQIRGASHQADGNSHVTTRVMGTSGYAAPEYVATGHLYVKSDVYSFGVVFLEILTGFRAIDTNRAEEMQNLVEWAKPFLSNNRNLKEIMDKRLGDQYPPEGANQAAQLALKCVNHDPNERPSMIQVLENLEQIYAIQ